MLNLHVSVVGVDTLLQLRSIVAECSGAMHDEDEFLMMYMRAHDAYADQDVIETIVRRNQGA